MRMYDAADAPYLCSENGIAAPDINKNSGIIKSQKRKPSHWQCVNCVLKNSAAAPVPKHERLSNQKSNG